MTGRALVAAALIAVAAAVAIRADSRARLATVMAARDRREGSSQARLRLISVGAVAAGALWLLAGGWLAIAVLFGVAIGGAVSRRVRAQRSERATRAAVGELCRAIAAELRAGATPGSAMLAAASTASEPLRTALRPVGEAAGQADAVELADALAAAARAGPGLDGLRRLAACWRVVVASGAATAPAVDRIAEALHDELDLDRALDASLAGPRATVRLLAALPLAGLALGAVIGARPLSFLLRSPAGVGCLVVAGALDAAGLAWANRIARRAARVG